MHLASIPYVSLLGFFFGSRLTVSRFSIGQYHPTNFIALQLLLASLGHVSIYAISRRRHWPKDWRLAGHAAVAGFIGITLPTTSILSSMQYQSSGITAVLVSVAPALTMVMAHFFLPDESLNLRGAIGVVLSFSGAAVLAILGESGLPDVRTVNPIGYGLVFLAVVSGSAAVIYIRKYMSDYDSFDVASLRMFFAALTFLPITGIVVGFDLSQVNRLGFLALGYASFGYFFEKILAVYIIQRFGATAAVMPAYIAPIVATVGGALLLREQITGGMLTGMALILVGIGIIFRNPGVPHGSSLHADPK